MTWKNRIECCNAIRCCLENCRYERDKVFQQCIRYSLDWEKISQCKK